MKLSQKPYRRTAKIIGEHILDNSSKSALDIGCGIPYALLELYTLKKCQKLTAVEQKEIGTEEVNFGDKTLDTLNLIDGIQFNESTVYEEYNRIKSDSWLYNQCLKKTLFYGYIPIKKDLFDQLVSSKHFGTSVEEFIRTNSETFDIIIVSKLLCHIKVDRVELIRKIIEKLNIDGLLFLRLNSNGFQTSNNLNTTEISNILKFMKIEEIYEEDCNGQIHLIVIGRNGL